MPQYLFEKFLILSGNEGWLERRENNFSTFLERVQKRRVSRKLAPISVASLVDYENQQGDISWLRIADEEVPVQTVGVDTAIFEEIGLEGFVTCSPNEKSTDALNSLNQMSELFDQVSRHVVNFVDQVVWIKRPDKKATMSSGSHEGIPGICFLSDLSARYVPPKTTFPNGSSYAVLENLFHESLHQGLFAVQEVHWIVRREHWGKTVAIPWHDGEEWILEKVLHAWFVYENIIELRRVASDVLNWDDAYSGSIEFARNCATFLKGQLRSRRAFLDDVGNELLAAAG